MGTGFGIAALVITLLAFGVPVVTLYVVWLALLLAAVSGFFGNKAFPIASIVLCFINLMFLSPLTWAALAAESMQGGSALKTITIVLFIVPIVALFFGRKKTPESQSTE